MRRRGIGIGCVLFVGITALAALPSSGCAVDPDVAPAPAEVVANAGLRDEMRRLWVERATWTRLLIVDVDAALPSRPASRARLARNAEELGTALAPHVGRAVAARVTKLLDRPTRELAALATTFDPEDGRGPDAARAALFGSADEIADALAAALGGECDRDALAATLRAQATFAMSEIAARARSSWVDDARAFDDAIASATAGADLLTAAISRQPVADGPIPDDEAATEQRMRDLWRERAAWTRMLVVAELEGLPEKDTAIARLSKSAEDVAALLEPAWGQRGAAKLAHLLDAQTNSVAKMTAAARSGDAAALDAARVDGYAQADHLAYFLHEEEPRWALRDLVGMANVAFDQATNTVTFRLDEDWAADVLQTDTMAAHAGEIAELLGGAAARRVLVE